VIVRLGAFGAQWWETALGATLPAVVRSATYYTNYSPPVSMTGDQIISKYRDPTPNPYLAKAQPTIVFDTIFGRYVAAPYGEADPEGWKDVERRARVAAGVGIGTLLLIGGSLFLLGRSSAR
jgi:hypothetical protein